MRLRRPKLPSHWLSWVDPPDASGAETLHLATADRRLSLEGEFLRELRRDVFPLLDGAHTLEELRAAASSDDEPLLEVLETLAEEGVLVEGGEPASPEPQRNALQEWGLDAAQVEHSLADATVVVLGEGAIAQSAAAALRGLGCGTVRAYRRPPLAGEELAPLLRGAALVLCAVDASQTRALLSVQAASLREGVPALFCSASATEVALGPTVLPGATSCALCRQARAVACAADPAEELERLRQIEVQGLDDASARETLPLAARIAGEMAALEALRVLLGQRPETAGALRVVQVPSLASELHAVAPVPDCALCGGTGSSPAGLRALVSDRVGLVRSVAVSAGSPRVASALLSHLEPAPAVLTDQISLAAAVDAEQATEAAVAEALAFRCAARVGPVELAPMGKLRGAVLAPPELVLFSDAQYDSRACRWRPFDPESEVGWIHAVELGTGGAVWVPAHLVQLGGQRAAPDDDFCRTTASGLRAARSLPQAIDDALLDLLAHDAFLISWLLRAAPAPVEEEELGPIAQLLLGQIRAQGADLRLRELPVDLPVHAIAALALANDRPGPAAVVQVAAHPSRGACAERVLHRLAADWHHERLRMLAADDALTDPEQVVLEEDHPLLFHSREHLPRLSFLLEDGPAVRPPDEKLPEALRRLGIRTFAVDLTSPEVRAAGLHVARVLATRLLPLCAGYGQERLGTERLAQRARALPGGEPRELNRFPHPLCVGPRMAVESGVSP